MNVNMKTLRKSMNRKKLRKLAKRHPVQVSAASLVASALLGVAVRRLVT